MIGKARKNVCDVIRIVSLAVESKYVYWWDSINMIYAWAPVATDRLRCDVIWDRPRNVARGALSDGLRYWLPVVGEDPKSYADRVECPTHTDQSKIALAYDKAIFISLVMHEVGADYVLAIDTQIDVLRTFSSLQAIRKTLIPVRLPRQNICKEIAQFENRNLKVQKKEFDE